MKHAPTVRQILSDPDAGLLPYLRAQFQSEEFSQFKAQFSFHVDESSTSVNKTNAPLQITLSITIKLFIVVAAQTDPDEAMLHALEFQQMLDAELINWSQRSKQLLKPISEIKGMLSNQEEIPYHGGYLPGFEIVRKFTLTYTSV